MSERRRDHEPRGGSAPADDDKPDLAPMIDIVFNLLIFFMCATTFRTQEGLIEAFLPKDRGPSTSTPVIDLREVRIGLARVDAAGRSVDEGGSLVVRLGAQTLNALGELDGPTPELSPVWQTLHARLRELLAGPARAGAPLPVIIDARPDVPTQVVVSALNEVVRAGLKEVTFAMPERPY